MSRKIGMVLSGCGVYDGSEAQEVVLALLALDRRGAEVVACAPDVPQLHVVDHLSGKVEAGAVRNVLVESARLTRGSVRDVASVGADEIDGLVLPGGYGAAKNLCGFAMNGTDCSVDPGVERLILDVHEQGKPIAAFCIAPALLARVLGGEHPDLTIGSDPATAAALEVMGAHHVPCPGAEARVDRQRRIVTTPAYMASCRISEVAEGIAKTIDVLLEMAGEPRPEEAHSAVAQGRA
jgi:enhancing lycopene biosynthesis protein 2